MGMVLFVFFFTALPPTLCLVPQAPLQHLNMVMQIWNPKKGELHPVQDVKINAIQLFFTHSLTPQQSDSFTSQPPSPVPSASSSDVLQPPAKRKKMQYLRQRNWAMFKLPLTDFVLCKTKYFQMSAKPSRAAKQSRNSNTNAVKGWDGLQILIKGR